MHTTSFKTTSIASLLFYSLDTNIGIPGTNFQVDGPKNQDMDIVGISKRRPESMYCVFAKLIKPGNGNNY